PLLVDWRAPAARPFYTATAARPEGLVRRRHFRTRGRTLVDAHDDVFAPEAADGSAGADAALLAALDAPRTGPMRDIVATIQAEQDEIIRLDHTGITVIEGGPGTGKTAVALHRVAYLLFTHPQLARRGVLVLGPNPRFLTHISAVLPSLGETDVVFATPGELLPGVATDVEDTPHAARAKGSLAMVDVLAAAVPDREEAPDEPVPIELEDVTVEATPEPAAAARHRGRPPAPRPAAGGRHGRRGHPPRRAREGLARDGRRARRRRRRPRGGAGRARPDRAGGRDRRGDPRARGGGPRPGACAGPAAQRGARGVRHGRARRARRPGGRPHRRGLARPARGPRARRRPARRRPRGAARPPRPAHRGRRALAGAQPAAAARRPVHLPAADRPGRRRAPSRRPGRAGPRRRRRLDRLGRAAARRGRRAARSPGRRAGGRAAGGAPRGRRPRLRGGRPGAALPRPDRRRRDPRGRPRARRPARRTPGGGRPP